MIAFILFCSLDIKFNFNTGAFLSSKSSPELRIFYEVARNELTFIKAQAEACGYQAKFRISCSLRHKDKEIGDMWIIEDTVKDYESTLSKELIRGEIKLQAPPGDYKFKIVINDLNSQRIGEKTSQVTIKELKKGQNISSLMSYEEEADIVLFFEVYSFDGLPFRIQYEVGEIKDSVKFDTPSFVNPARLEFSKDSLGFGTHTVKVSSDGVEVRDIVRVEAPFWSKDYEKRVAQLYYIGESWEIDSLLKTSLDKRKDGWGGFWMRKDSIFGIGVEELETEYFSRVDYANEHFSAIREGWRTDRGKIYIKLGKPDEKSSHPFEIDREPYEVWYYYSWNLKFVFVDKQGFGDYTLEYPKFWDEKIRFR